MKKIKFYLLSFLAITFLIFCFAGCDNNPDSDSMETSTLKVKMTDAPGDYKEVNIDVRDILIKNNSNSDDQGWVSIGNLPAEGTIFNLMDLTGGVTVLLADEVVPSGYLGQVRLLLGDNNTVVLDDGSSHVLDTPSAQQSGLKLQVNQTLVGGVTYTFLLDFDVDRSVVKAGNSGKYNLHPVIRVTTSAASGVIKGTIADIATTGQVLASVMVGTEIISAYTDEAGVFQLNGVPAGTYIVTLTPDPLSESFEKTIPEVIVVNGQITDLGPITF
ncbi:MAG TPA: DUF4382 domain-containing protein [Flavobacterium sp.]